MPAAKKRDVEGKEKWPHRGGCDHLRYVRGNSRTDYQPSPKEEMPLTQLVPSPTSSGSVPLAGISILSSGLPASSVSICKCAMMLSGVIYVFFIAVLC